MTGWTDVALSNLLGGVSEVLGTPFPSAPRGGGPFPEDGAAITDRGEVTVNDRAKLQYMGIDPDTASLDQINKALEHDAPTSPPPPPPPDPQAPPPPTDPSSAPPGMSGSAVDAAKRLDDALAKNHSAINDADDELADAVLKATSSSDEGRKRLQGLQQEIVDEVNKLDSTLDTAPGQQQLAEFLQNKTGDILDVLKNGSLDADSQAKVLDGLTARYQALHDGGKGSGDDPSNPGGTPQDPGGTPAPGAPGAPGAAGTDPGDTGGAGDDDPSLEGGLPSDAMMGGLGALGPAMGALGGLPAALGSAIPGLGGGGGGLGDLGEALGSALRDPGHDSADEASDEHAGPLKDPNSQPSGDKSQDGTQQAGNQGDKSQGGTQNAGAGSAAPPAAAAPGQVPAASTQVQLPDNSVRTADSPALAQAGRAVLGGGDIDEAYSAAGLQLPPVGSAVSAPVSPSRLQFGDIGQYTDHRVMALGKDTVWINGQVTPIDQLESGPNFLGWAHATATTSPAVTASATVPATPPPAPAAS
jgi:hypothetical protein